MNVRMEGKVASPGVEDADEPDLCTQMSLVPGKLFQSCGAAVIEQAEEKASVRKKEAVELLRHSEDSVKIRRINDIGLPGVDPFFLVHCLAAGAVPVAARIVVYFDGTAVLTDRGIATEKSRFAADDGDCDFMGFRSNRSRLAVIIIGLREDVLDRIAHNTHRTSKGLTAFPIPVRARWT